MREIRLEEINEAVLSEIIQPMPDIDKNCPQMETPKHTPENKRDQARKRLESNYREDETVR